MISNCFLWALYQVWRHGAKIRTMKSKMAPLLPHYYVLFPNGKVKHFMFEKDILPYPLCFVAFKGIPTEMSKAEKRLIKQSGE